jgi:hypothetical protein
MRSSLTPRRPRLLLAAMPASLGIRKYARTRGVTHEAIRQAIHDGRLPLGPDGRIDPALADRTWFRRYQARQAGPPPDPAWLARIDAELAENERGLASALTE